MRKGILSIPGKPRIAEAGPLARSWRVVACRESRSVVPAFRMIRYSAPLPDHDVRPPSHRPLHSHCARHLGRTEVTGDQAKLADRTFRVLATVAMFESGFRGSGPSDRPVESLVPPYTRDVAHRASGVPGSI